MSARSLLPVHTDRPDRQGRDRLEILTALIHSPSFDPVFREPIIRIPRGHAVYRWECLINQCERVRDGGTDLCSVHRREWNEAKERGVGKAAFVTAAEPLGPSEWIREESCRICPQRPAAHTATRLCVRHQTRWLYLCRSGAIEESDFAQWLGEQEPLTGYGECQAAVCVSLAYSPLGLCSGHRHRYRLHGRPGGASLPDHWWHSYERIGQPVPVVMENREEFRAWCTSVAAVTWPGQINLRGLSPLLRAEIQWGMFRHAEQTEPGRWDLEWIQRMVNACRESRVDSLVDLDLGALGGFSSSIVREMRRELQLIYFAPDDCREAGFLETDHFGIRFDKRASHIDLTAVPQRWLRDLLWDHLADLLRSPRCPRTATAIDSLRRACTELGAFLEVDAPGGGHDPGALRAEHMQRFVADQRRRERDSLPSIALTSSTGKPPTVTTHTRRTVFNSVRRVLRDALEDGTAERLGLDREFITAMPAGGGAPLRARRPFPDEAARALADGANLQRLADAYDPSDHGLRDIWEAIVTTGRRTSEVLKLRWECIGRYGGLPMFWHDQTKVGNYDAAIRIPESLYELLAERQRKTLEKFTARHGHAPSPQQRAAMVLFPRTTRNSQMTTSLSYTWFIRGFRLWVDELDLGRLVPHQARHTLATNLLRHGATLTHIRRYLGQVSDRMAEYYVHLTSSDLDNVLQHVWVAGPGTAQPGEFLAGDATPLTREQAQALAIDLSRRSTPAEGGFCTFQPVVDGGACPWNLDCHNCDKFVLSVADLLYWRRKREQWRLLAEGAPDDATADYLHRYFEPTARAIDGLEKALAGLGLLDDALALDLRKPQDYFHRIWSTAFRATDLAEATEAEDAQKDEYDAEFDAPEGEAQT
ncbi:site-specific integrase [Streptomyces sp. MB09-02B]|uniref:tyrosine-type recombinase/integrase n=1 Tax=Streptomyces sp. MB09-02B TaxID=3028667 RepID=UPI0029BD2C6D|nr:site-specific integrase [Streptomyces sp. MB09-02B]MDX3641793.1 site-specific integrase [Streptomyces sp. MB09-02B]